MTPKVLEAINQQIANEFGSSFSYLAMAAWCEHHNYTGAGQWFRLQSSEEHTHAMRLFNFALARNHQARLAAIEKPTSEFASLLEVFETAQTQEQNVSRQIDALYQLAFEEKVFAAMAELQWFITEQVEEEKELYFRPFALSKARTSRVKNSLICAQLRSRKRLGEGSFSASSKACLQRFGSDSSKLYRLHSTSFCKKTSP